MPLFDQDRNAPSRRRLLLERGEKEGWGWDFESTNPPGHVDSTGQTHDGVTHTLAISDSVGDWELTIPTEMVEGFALWAAWQAGGADAVRQLGYPIHPIEDDEGVDETAEHTG